MPVAAAVLAAGAGSRMGTPKGELVVDGARLVDRAVAAATAAGCAPVLAVVRSGVEVAGAVVVVNDAPERGMRSSLELAVAALAPGDPPPAGTGAQPRAAGADALLVILVDTPGLGAEAIRAVAAAWQPGRAVTARVDGRRTPPVVMEPALWREAIALAGADEGARRWLQAHPDLVDDVEVTGTAADLDTPDDLAAWTARRDPPPDLP